MSLKLSEREPQQEERIQEARPLIDWHRLFKFCLTPVRKIADIQTPKPIEQAILSVPKPVRVVLFRPILVVAVIFHYWILTLPSPSDPPSEPDMTEEVEEEIQEEEVRITKLQTTQTEPPPQATPPPATPPSNPQPSNRATLPSLEPTPTATPTPTEAPTSSDEPTPTPTPTSTPNPKSEATPEPTPSPSPTPDPGQGTTLEDPFNDFPFPPNAATGSLGLLSAESDAEARNIPSDIDGVYGFYTSVLPERNISIGEPVKNEQNFRIYPLTPQVEGIEPQFLHLVFHQNKTVIFRATQAVTELAALQDAESISVEERQFEQAINAAGNDLTLSQFRGVELAQGATQFCCNPNRYRPKGITVAMFQTTLDDLKATVTSRLQEQSFSIRPTSYQGVEAFEVQLSSFTGYVIFAPAYQQPGRSGPPPYAMFTSTTPP
ncbi:MAG: hypothetical protein J7641_08155 [Cyanobacteria bacterium SID2]|nr:hypothetical protein [Cyanobacteria bacterium SID2]MBP0003477.1 hypothetical protein [Cyanobacteria bacterium SBC]